MKVITFTFDGYGEFSIDKEPIAIMEAYRRIVQDNELTFKDFKEQFDYLMADDFDIYDFIVNSMDYEDFEPYIVNKKLFGQENWKSKFNNSEKSFREEDL